MADEVRRSRIYKARFVGGPTVPAPESKQLIEDPFTSITGYGGAIRAPIYSFEQLVLLAEQHPIHGAALEQRAADVISQGPKLVPIGDDAPEEQRDNIEAWLESLTEQETFTELLFAMELDHVTLAWGMLEVARDTNGKVRRLYSIPAHTVRAHQDKRKLVQIRQGRQVWFKRWGMTDPDEKILASTGNRAPEGTSPDKIANELLVFMTPSRRSTWYGIPNYITAIGHIALAVAARDYNVSFFNNAREPRLVFICSGQDDEQLEEFMDDLEQSLRTQHAEPHRHLLIPTSGDADVRIERITAVQNDMHFARLMEMTERNILIAHRVPPDRVGAVMRGFLGGNVATNITRIYKDAVVTPAQAVVQDRLNRFLKTEYARYAEIDESDVRWRLEFADLDLSDKALDTNIVISKVKNNLLTLNEGREELGLARREEWGDKTLAEFLADFGGGGQQMVADAEALSDRAADERTLRAIVERLDELDEQIQELLISGELPQEGVLWEQAHRSGE